MDGAKLATANGGNITFTIGDGRVFVDNARIVISDILIANGVIHVIDEVLNPSNQTISNPTSQQGTPVYEGATPVPDVPYTSGQPTSTTPQSRGSTSVGLSPGAKAGISIGAVLGSALIIGLIYFFFKRRKKTHLRQKYPPFLNYQIRIEIWSVENGS